MTLKTNNQSKSICRQGQIFFMPFRTIPSKQVKNKAYHVILNIYFAFLMMCSFWLFRYNLCRYISLHRSAIGLYNLLALNISDEDKSRKLMSFETTPFVLCTQDMYIFKPVYLYWIYLCIMMYFYRLHHMHNFGLRFNNWSRFDSTVFNK